MRREDGDGAEVADFVKIKLHSFQSMHEHFPPNLLPKFEEQTIEIRIHQNPKINKHENTTWEPNYSECRIQTKKMQKRKNEQIAIRIQIKQQIWKPTILNPTSNPKSAELWTFKSQTKTDG